MDIDTAVTCGTVAKPTTELVPTKLQLLPCRIESRIDADIDTHFTVKPAIHTKTHNRGTPSTHTAAEAPEGSMCATFRGRELHGGIVDVPAGYRGIVFESEPKKPGEHAHWTPKLSFSSLTYWNHDDEPSEADVMRRSMDWLKVAGAVRYCMMWMMINTNIVA